MEHVLYDGEHHQLKLGRGVLGFVREGDFLRIDLEDGSTLKVPGAFADVNVAGASVQVNGDGSVTVALSQDEGGPGVVFTVPAGVGPQGVQGVAGPQGPQGPAGPPGDAAVLSPELAQQLALLVANARFHDWPMVLPAATLRNDGGWGLTVHLQGDIHNFLAATTVSVDWGDGSAAFETAVSPSGGLVAVNAFGATHTYAQPGSYTITARLSSSLGESAPVTMAVQAELIQPVPAFGTEGRGNQFATLINASEHAVSCRIDWGDGSAPSDMDGVPGATALHVYEAGGAYTVTLTAINPFGSQSATAQWLVERIDPPAKDWRIVADAPQSGSNVGFSEIKLFDPAGNALQPASTAVSSWAQGAGLDAVGAVLFNGDSGDWWTSNNEVPATVAMQFAAPVLPFKVELHNRSWWGHCPTSVALEFSTDGGAAWMRVASRTQVQWEYGPVVLSLGSPV